MVLEKKMTVDRDDRSGNMKEELSRRIPEKEIIHEILRLKKEKNVLILGHNYMESTLFHSVPDFTGDSLELARKAAVTDKDIILFCGVEFMAETAKILNPEKTVLIPAQGAGCSLAESISAEDVRQLKRQFPGVPVVTYINTYAEVKAESDVCCTSGNARSVVESLNSDSVIFLPDENLAGNVAEETGKHIIFPAGKVPGGKDYSDKLDYQMIGWHGSCEVHERFTVDNIREARRRFPDVAVLAHPECPPEVVEASDYSASTSAMLRIIEEKKNSRYLILTESAMGDNIAVDNPDLEILELYPQRCPYMNMITLENTLTAIQKNRYRIELPEEIRISAARAVERMIEIG